MTHPDFGKTDEEQTFTSPPAKSRVKLMKSVKGIITWEISCIVGEADLMQEIKDEAVKIHNQLNSEFPPIQELKEPKKELPQVVLPVKPTIVDKVISDKPKTGMFAQSTPSTPWTRPE